MLLADTADDGLQDLPRVVLGVGESLESLRRILVLDGLGSLRERLAITLEQFP